MIGTCDEGDLEWVEGPYVCNNPCDNSWPDYDHGCYGDKHANGFNCAGSPREHPTTDRRKLFSGAESSWPEDAVLLGLCRYRDLDYQGVEEWVMGES